jgi:hypothetical protein
VSPGQFYDLKSTFRIIRVYKFMASLLFYSENQKRRVAIGSSHSPLRAAGRRCLGRAGVAGTITAQAAWGKVWANVWDNHQQAAGHFREPDVRSGQPPGRLNQN